MLLENYALGHISDIEWESIRNYVIKDCYEIIHDEIEYFFNSKEHLMDFFFEGLEISALSEQKLKQRFCKMIFSDKELENLEGKLEKRISREMERVTLPNHFSLKNKFCKVLDLHESFCFICEELRTLKFSCSTAKAINMIWKKGCQGFIPKDLRRFGARFKAGDYLLSTVGLSPSEIGESVNKSIGKRLRAILKQKKSDIINLTKKEVISYILYIESKRPKCKNSEAQSNKVLIKCAI